MIVYVTIMPCQRSHKRKIPTTPLDISPIYLNGTPVTVVNKDKHLGNYISTNTNDRNIISNVCDFYQRSNSVISDFGICDSETLDKIQTT